jgi:hypothetical protein
MRTAIWLLLLQASLGAFDTLYYHEYRLRLAHGEHTRVELRLHASRDFAYAIIIGSLGFVTWHGAFAWVLHCRRRSDDNRATVNSIRRL